MGIKCFQCAAEVKLEIDKLDPASEDYDALVDLYIAGIPEADVYVPVWQQKQVFGNTVVGIVSLPICIRKHMVAGKKTPEQMAIEGGHVLPGGLGKPDGRL